MYVGYLTYDFDTKISWIPNVEVPQEFDSVIQDNGFEYVMKAVEQSNILLGIYTGKVHNENSW